MSLNRSFQLTETEREFVRINSMKSIDFQISNYLEILFTDNTNVNITPFNPSVFDERKDCNKQTIIR